MNGLTCPTAKQTQRKAKILMQQEKVGDLSSRQKITNTYRKQKLGRLRGYGGHQPRRDGWWHRDPGDQRWSAPAHEIGRESSRQPGRGTRKEASTHTSSGTGRAEDSRRKRSYQTKEKAM